MAGQLPLLPAIKKLMDEVMAGPSPWKSAKVRSAPSIACWPIPKTGPVRGGHGVAKYMMGLSDQQEVMGALADCIMEVFALESCILRTEKLIAAKGEAGASRPSR
jgi:butyryl-CoA dehydrogenase